MNRISALNYGKYISVSSISAARTATSGKNGQDAGVASRKKPNAEEEDFREILRKKLKAA